MQNDEELLARCESRVGGTLGTKWHLDRLLGVGGMAAVYAARNPAGTRTAIKLLHKNFARNPGIVARFQREAYIANKIDHPGVVQILEDDVTPEGEPYLVMELLLGHSVDQLLQQAGGRLATSRALHIVERTLDVLEKAHSIGVIHRDLKPDNLLVTNDGLVKVLDFGIARLLEGQKDSGHTRTGVIMGTPAFMAPEQALGRWQQVSPRTDLWSVGAILFLLVSGRVVHGDVQGNELLIRAATQSAPSLGRVVQAPLPLVRLVDRALAYDAKRRFPDAATMRHEVAGVLRELGDAVVSQRPSQGSRHPLSAFEAPTVAPHDVHIPAQSSAPMSPKTMGARLEAESIVDERFASSVVNAYRAALKNGSEENVTTTLRAGLRRLAARQPDTALSLLVALCQTLDEHGRRPDAEKLKTAFATAVVSTRTLRTLLLKALEPDADERVYLAGLRPLLASLGDSHAGVALEVLPAVPDGELKDLLVDYVAKNGGGYEVGMGALFSAAEPNLGRALVQVLAKMGTPEAKKSLRRALESPHAVVRIEARTEMPSLFEIEPAPSKPMVSSFPSSEVPTIRKPK